jgi:hypothetical protein
MMDRVLVATTICGYKAKDDEVLDWLDVAEEMVDISRDSTYVVEFFASIEIGQGFDDYFGPILQRLKDLNGTWWTFSLGDREAKISTHNRLAHICTGRNIIHEYAARVGHEHVLFLDSDTRVPADTIDRLLELQWPIVGGNVPTYCLQGPKIQLEGWDPSWDVQNHWNTAGLLMVNAELIRKLRWRSDGVAGMSDDPCFAADALALGYPTYVRHDLVGRHHRPNLPPLEQRDHDLRVLTKPWELS